MAAACITRPSVARNAASCVFFARQISKSMDSRWDAWDAWYASSASATAARVLGGAAAWDAWDAWYASAA
eukprot:scaffold300_cov258-Pinguiococcus_pyrenoidosus.AAC.2